uniref:Large ribosomal subunit protein bL32c n=1 Tax=Dicranema revolutum TaxID=239144 RepID=A0A4D6WUR7_9FLOR|nr:ribosomal protein L32 [Dicranema revolutum]
MAVPKQRTSKSKSKSRKAKWKRQAYFKSQKAISLAKSLLTQKSNSFIYLGSATDTNITQ